MAYVCQFCVGESRTFDTWRALVGHNSRNHPGERPDKEVSLIKEERVNAEADGDAEAVANMPEAPPPPEVSTPPRPQVVLNAEAIKIRDFLLFHGVDNTIANRIASIFSSYKEYQTPAMLNTICKNNLPSTQQWFVPTLVEQVYPQSKDSIKPHLSPLEELGKDHLDLLKQVAVNRMTGGSDGDAEWQKRYFDLLQTSYGNMLSQVTDALKESKQENRGLRLQLEDRKLQLPQPDFEVKVLESIDERLIPFAASEARALRQDVKEIAREVFGNIGPNIKELTKRGPISAAESEKLADVMSLRQQIWDTYTRMGNAPRWQPESVAPVLTSPQAPGVSYE